MENPTFKLETRETFCTWKSELSSAFGSHQDVSVPDSWQAIFPAQEAKAMQLLMG